MATTLLYSQIEAACRQVESQIQKDNNFPDLRDLLGTQSHVSGDYTNPKKVLQKIDVIPLPASLNALYTKNLEYKTFMGIFPEINRVWMTIDSNLYLWDYEDGHKFVGYTGSQIIVGVALAKPLAGVWSPPPAWVLVVATITQVILLSVNFIDGELRIEETGFSASVDGIGMMCITATNEGRVFLGGFNGNLYELSYCERSAFSIYSPCRLTNIDLGISGAVVKQFSPFLASWFYKKDSIIKVVIDHERSILYTLTQDSQISVYDIGGLSECKKVGTTFEVNKHIQQFMQNNVKVNVTNIFVIKQKESKALHLLGVTEEGLRLYFSTSDVTLVNTQDSTTRQPPRGLFMVHAKRPGNYPFQAGCGPVSVASYYQGVFVCADSRNVGKDNIVASVPDYSALSNRTATTNQLSMGAAPQSSSFTFSEIPGEFSAEVTVLSIQPELQPQQDALTLSPLNLLVRQHLAPPPVLIFVSSRGIFKMNYIRPIDELASILRYYSETHIEAFLKNYGASRVCAMALHIAILGEPILQEPAKKAFARVQGAPQYGATQPSPSAVLPTTQIGTTVVNPTFTNSSGYDGVVLLLSCFFNSFWSRPLCVEQPYNPKLHAHKYELLPQLVKAGVAKAPPKPPDTVLVSRWESQVLEDMSVFLQNMTGFFRTNSKFMPAEPPLPPIAPNNPFYRQQAAQSNEAQARYREDMELYQISLFVYRALDACNFLIILAPFFPTLSPDLPPDVRSFLLNSQFRDLICTPTGLTTAQLLMEILSKYASNRGMDVSNLSSSLLRACPSFFSQLEKTKSSADDLLNKAIVVGSTDGIEPSVQALEYLQPALRLYMSIVPKFDLGEVPDRFINLAFYPGVLELCFAYAEAVDPHDRALKWYNQEDETRKAGDTEGHKLFNERQAAYQHILKVFDTLKKNPMLSLEEQQRREAMAADVKEMIFHHAINSRDELFHYAWYEWYFSRGMGQEVVLMDTPFIESYLKAKHREALTQYYIRLQRYNEAAEVLAEQAELPNMDINDRVDNLSRAASAINASPISDPEFARSVQDSLDVALVQQRISDLAGDNAVVKASLNESLLSLEQLFHVANQNNLTQGQLLVLSAANYKDEPRVRYLWESIINTTYKRTNDMRAVVAMVVSVITSLVTKTNDYVPLKLLLDLLERLSAEAPNAQPSFVFSHLVGTSQLMEPLNLWLEYYDLLQDTYWNDPERRMHIYIILSDLLEYWYKTSMFAFGKDRNAGYVTLGLSTKIDDIISGLGKLGFPKAADCREKFVRLRANMFK